MESRAMVTPTTNTVNGSSTVSFIHRHYLLLKAHYFLFFSAFGILYPILNITLRGRGLSNSEISSINIIIPFLVCFTTPLLGYVADHSRRYLLTFNSIIFTVTVLYGLMFLLPTIKTHHIQANMVYDAELQYVLDFCASQEVSTKCSSRSACGCSYLSSCLDGNTLFSFAFTMNSKNMRGYTTKSTDINEFSPCGIQYRVPIDEHINNYTSNLHHSVENASILTTCEITCSVAHFCQGTRYHQQTLVILFYSLLFIVATIAFSTGIAIGASIGFASLSHPELFGRQRICGTIGFGLAAFVASRVYDMFKMDLVYIIMFSITTFICIIITSFIHILPRHNKTNENFKTVEQETMDMSRSTNTMDVETQNKSRLKAAALIPLLKKIDVLVFLSLTFIWGMSFAALDPYLYLYIDEIAPCKSHTIVGRMSIIAATAELVAFLVAAKFIKLVGTNISSIVILLAFAVRFFGYYSIPDPTYLVFMETMQFFNFGILYVLIAQKADAIAPPGLSGTLQGIVYGVSFGFGRGIGLIFALFINRSDESKHLFLMFALLDASAAMIYSFYFVLRARVSKKPVKTHNNLNIPKIVIESETNINDEPIVMSSPFDRVDDHFIEQ